MIKEKRGFALETKVNCIFLDQTKCTYSSSGPHATGEAGGVSLESQGRGYEVSFRTLPLLALLLFVCLPEKDSAEVVRSQL